MSDNVRLALLIGSCAVVCAGCSARDEARDSAALAQEIAALEGAVANAKQTLQRLKDYDELRRTPRARTATTSTSRATTTSRIYFLATASSRSTAAACFWGRIASGNTSTT